MKIKQIPVSANGIRFSIEHDGKEAGRAYLYILKNDLHDQPFGFMEDVFVHEGARGQGIGKQLVQELTERARKIGCYKLVANSRHSRPEVHALYDQLGFINHGIEFRINFEVPQT